VEQPNTEDVFKAAAEAGVQELKLGYWTYKDFGTFRKSLDEVNRKLDDLEKLALKTGVRANIHNHSGPYIAGLGPVLWNLIKDRDPKAIGAFIDPCHLIAEGGLSGWKISLDLIRERISLIAVKDMQWKTISPAGAKPKLNQMMVPLKEGLVPWPEIFGCLKQIGFGGWLSLHSEYQGAHSWRDLSTKQVIEQTREDLVYLREVIQQSSK
jgi:sugar phosphate isomerase/epimerase